MSSQQGDRTPEMREGRARLSVCDPHVEKLLAGLIIDEPYIDDARQFGNRLQADARRWMLRGGLASPRHLTKADAYRLFAYEFGGAPSRNSGDGVAP